VEKVSVSANFAVPRFQASVGRIVLEYSRWSILAWDRGVARLDKETRPCCLQAALGSHGSNCTNCTEILLNPASMVFLRDFIMFRFRGERSNVAQRSEALFSRSIARALSQSVADSPVPLPLSPHLGTSRKPPVFATRGPARVPLAHPPRSSIPIKRRKRARFAH
jgi:hypothetical protein